MGNPKLLDESESLSQEVGKMLFAFLNKLRSNATARPTDT